MTLRFLATTFATAIFMFLISSCTRTSREIRAPKEKVFRYVLPAKIPSLDPHQTNDVYSSQVQSLIYENLYDFHYLKRPYELIPNLAEELPQMSKDRKILTIKLKKGVHFQDNPCFSKNDGKGREFVAEDVSYMLHRVASNKRTSPIYGNLEHRIIGIDDYHSGKADKISGVKVLDPHTIEIQLTQALPRFAYNFVQTHTAIVPKECVEKYGDQFAMNPVGTGPFVVDQYNPAHKVVLSRNPNYKHMQYPTEGMPGDREKGLLDDAGQSLPFLDKVVFEILAEDQPAWLKFMSGEIELSRIPKDNFNTALPNGKLAPELEKRGVQHFKQVRADVNVALFNMDDPVWGKHKELRQAFALAADWDKLIEIYLAGQAVRANSFVNTTDYGYDPNFKTRWMKRDLKKARELLAKAGFPGGKGLPPLSMPSSSGTAFRQRDELLQRQLAEVGIVFNSEPLTWPEIDKRLHEKNFAMIVLAYAGDIPDFDSIIDQFHSRSVSPGPNAANYRNAEVDKLLDEIEAMDNGPARLAKIHRFKEIVDDELPYFYFAHRIGNQLVQPWVKNHIFVDEMFLGRFMKYQKVIPTK